MRLREYTTPRQVPRYRCAIAPGKHCPLFGVGSVLRGIRGLTLIYVGPRDCVYYAQKTALEYRLSTGNDGLRVLAAHLGADSEDQIRIPQLGRQHPQAVVSGGQPIFQRCLLGIVDTVPGPHIDEGQAPDAPKH